MKVGNFEILVRTTQGSSLPEVTHGPETYVVARSGSAFTVHVKRGEDGDGHTPCVKVCHPFPDRNAKYAVDTLLLLPTHTRFTLAASGRACVITKAFESLMNSLSLHRLSLFCLSNATMIVMLYRNSLRRHKHRAGCLCFTQLSCLAVLWTDYCIAAVKINVLTTVIACTGPAEG
jgi:hypothetical protein